MLFVLPYEHLGSVLAHELGHAWLFLNHYPKLPNKLEEGFCELLSTYWLQSRDNDLARVRLNCLKKILTGLRERLPFVQQNHCTLFAGVCAGLSLKRHADLPDNA